MRLTDEVLRESGRLTDDTIAQSMALAAAGRFGLFPSARPFRLQLSIAKGFVDVETLDCLAITRSGLLIDAEYDTKFTNSFDTRVRIPDNDEAKDYILTVARNPEAWQDGNEGYETPQYTFALLASNAVLPDNAMPIGRIVNDNGWREDNTVFVPPCLYVSSHPKLEELHAQFVNLLRSIDEKSRQQVSSGAQKAISIYWPTVQQTLIAVTTEYEEMTPMRLQSCVQQVVGAFVMGCELDDALTLEDASTFYNYAHAPYNYKVACPRIKQGLGLCLAIDEKIDKFSLLQSVKAPEPPKEEPQPKIDKPRLWGGKRI